MIGALVAALALQPLAAQPAAPLVISPAPLTLRAGTAVHFVTEAAIDSRSVRQGQRFTIIIAEDVSVDGKLVLPKGTRAVGEVDAVTGKGMFGQAGSLVLRPLFVDLDSQRINFDGLAEKNGKGQVGGAAVTTILTGGLGLFITGKSATMAAGSPLEGWVRSDVLVQH